MDSMQEVFGGGGGATDSAPAFANFPAASDPLAGVTAAQDSGSTFETPSISSAPAGSSGGGLNIGKILGAVAPTVPGALGFLLNKGNSTDKATKALNREIAPMQAAARQDLGAYTSGTLTPAQQASVDQFKKQQMAKWQQQLAQMGIPVGSAQADISAKIEQDAAAYAQNLLQQDFQNAYQGMGLTTSNLQRIAQMQALQDAEQRKQWQEFAAALGKLGTDVGPIFE